MNEYNYLNQNIQPSDFQIATNQRILSFTYGWMFLALSLTGFISLAIAHFSPLTDLIETNMKLFFVLVIAELVLVFYLSAMINRMSLFSAALCFILYSILNGVTIAPIFLIYTQSSIASTFFITGGTFAAMSLYGFFTKQDLTKWGNILIMALIGLIIATIVNIFIASSSIYWITSFAGVLIFVGLTAFDTQKIKEMNMSGISDLESNQKLAIIGALTLYLDFINLFLYLLRFFGKER